MPFFPFEVIVLLVVERLKPGWKLPDAWRWKTRVFFSLVSKIFAFLLALVLFKKLSNYSVFHLSLWLPFAATVVIGYLTTTMVKYWWHRWRHASSFLWRVFHQLHHSATRIEVLTTFYKHPIEPLYYTAMHFAVLKTFLGLSQDATYLCIVIVTAGEVFQHANFKTARWLGYLISTPEIHRVHHTRDKHWNNFSDFVLWDMVFGTYENPLIDAQAFGFDSQKENRVVEMLKFSDVNSVRIDTQP